MDSLPTRVQVKILDEEYTIVGDTDEETIRQVARIVDERMRELKMSLPHASLSRLAVLCAMNLADELLQVRNSESGVSGILEERTKKIISLLEEGIIGDIYP